MQRLGVFQAQAQLQPQLQRATSATTDVDRTATAETEAELAGLLALFHAHVDRRPGDKFADMRLQETIPLYVIAML